MISVLGVRYDDAKHGHRRSSDQAFWLPSPGCPSSRRSCSRESRPRRLVLPTLEEDRDTAADPAGSRRPTGVLAWRSWLRPLRRWRAGLAGLPALLRRHWIFAVAL